MKYRRTCMCLIAAVLLTIAATSRQAGAFDLSSLNPFGPLGRITGRIKPPNMRQSFRKMNRGTKKVLSGTRDILFPWTTSSQTITPPPPPTGTRRVYPANNRPNS